MYECLGLIAVSGLFFIVGYVWGYGDGYKVGKGKK